MLRILVILILGYIGLMTNASAQPIPTYQDAGQGIVVTQTSPEFMILEPANPTTGYKWTLVYYDSNLLTLESETYLPPQSNLMGAGGTMRWVFKATTPALMQTQQTKIHLVYARPWNPQDNPTDLTFGVLINP